MSDEKPTPFSEREYPVEIRNEEKGSYTIARLDDDYNLFLEWKECYDPDLPTGEKQKALFRLFENNEVSDPGQAWEWWFGKKWEYWSDEECSLAATNSTNEAQADLKRLRGDRVKNRLWARRG